MKKGQIIGLTLLALLLLIGCVLLFRQPVDTSVKDIRMALVPEKWQDEIYELTINKGGNTYVIAKNNGGFTVTGLEQETVNQGITENIFYRACHLESIAGTESIDDVASGLANPTLSLKLKTQEGDVLDISVGKKSDLLEGYFARVSGDEKVYVVDGSFPEEIPGTVQMYQNLSLVNFVYESDYNELEYLEISGKNIITTAFENTEDGFTMVKPMQQLCEQSAVKNVFLHSALHLKANEYVGDVKEKEMGFNNPEYRISMEYKGEKIRILIGTRVGEKRYICKDSSPDVYLINESSLSFLDEDYRKAIGDCLYPRSVSVVDGITIQTDEETFRLTGVVAAGDGYEAFFLGEKVEQHIFQPLFNSIRNLELLKNISAPGITEMRIEIFLKDGRKDEILLGQLNDREYSVSINGTCSFSTSKASVERIKDKVAKLKDMN